MLRQLVPMFLLLSFLPGLSGNLAFAGFNDLEVNGFFSTGLSMTDADKAKRNEADPDPIYDGSITPDPTAGKLTILGLSLQGEINENMRWQAVTSMRDEEVEPKFRLDQLNLRYDLGTNFHLRFGRLRAPVWGITEYFWVRAVQPWVRPPSEFYLGNFEVFSFDGGSATYVFDFGSVYLEAEAYAGPAKINVRTSRQEITGNAEDLYGGSLRFHGQNWALKANWTQANFRNYLSVPTAARTGQLNGDYDPTVITGITAIPPTPVDIDALQFFSFSAEYDDGKLFFIGEYGDITSSGITSQDQPNWNDSIDRDNESYLSLEKNTSWYVTPGIYLDDQKWLLHATYSEVNDEDYFFINGGGHWGTGLGLNRFLEKSMVVKVNWSTSSPKDSSDEGAGLFQGGARVNRPINVYEVSFGLTF